MSAMPERIKVWRYASTSKPSAPPIRLARGAWDDRKSETQASDTEYVRADKVAALVEEAIREGMRIATFVPIEQVQEAFAAALAALDAKP